MFALALVVDPNNFTIFLQELGGLGFLENLDSIGVLFRHILELTQDYYQHPTV